MRIILLCLSLLLTTSPAAAQDGPLGLAAPDTVVDSGLLQYILPRFSLKTSIRVVSDADGVMQLTTAAPGVAVFQGDGITYYLRADDSKRQIRFRDWLLSDIGKRTIDNFQPDGVQLFSSDIVQIKTDDAPVLDGDTARGADLSLSLCGRCHVIGPQNRMKGLGSTPSFAVLRSLPDWTDRFEQFFVRAPHGAFTQIADVTLPFDPARPPPIVPLEMTLDDLDAIVAFVAQTKAADLGAPLQSQ